MGGLMSVTGQPNDPPTRAGNAMGDMLGGLNLTIGVLAALNARHITKKGQRVDVSLVDCVVASMETAPQRYFMEGKLPKRMGNRYAAIAPYDSYACRDGYFVLGCGNQKLYEKFCRDIIKLPGLITDERFKTIPLRVEHSDDFKVIVENWAKDYTVKDMVAWLDREGLPAAPIYTIKDVVEDKHISEAREMFVPFSHPVIGKMKVNGCPIKLMDTKTSLRMPAPTLGQHNKEILTEYLNYSEEEYDKLIENNIL
jgi:formyl-CoA transferase